MQFNTIDTKEIRMALLKKPIKQDERGFAFIAALLAMLIMVSLGVLIFTLTTRDIRVTIRLAGEKKAFTAAENGVHWVMQNFNPLQDPATLMNGSTGCPGLSRYYEVPFAVDSGTCFSLVQAPKASASGSSLVPMAGNSITGTQTFSRVPYDVTLNGTNIKYWWQFGVDFQIAYGPVNPTTTYQ